MKTRRLRSRIAGLLTTTVVGVIAASAVGLSAPSPPVAGAGYREASFARRAAGSFLVDIPARSERYLFALSSDGTVISEDSNDFGNGIPAASQSAFYGAWQRTGHRTIVYTVLNLAFDANGVHTTTVRHSATAVFDASFSSFEQEGDFAVFAAAQDPLDHDAVPLAMGEFAGTGRRIPASVE